MAEEKHEYPIAPTNYRLYKHEWRIVHDKDGHASVQVKLSADERAALLKKLPIPGRDFSNSSSVSLFENALAKARMYVALESGNTSAAPDNDSNTPSKIIDPMDAFLQNFQEKIATPLQELDKMINQAVTNPQQDLSDLIKKLQNYQQALTRYNYTTELDDSSGLNAFQRQQINKRLVEFQQNCRPGIERFIKKAQQLQNTNQQEVENLLKAQAITASESLGTCLGKQCLEACAAARDITGTIHGKYLNDILLKNKFSQAFISAHSEIRVKTDSLAGVEFNSTDYKPRNTEIQPSEAWLPFDYFKNNEIIDDLDKFICIVEGEAFSENRTRGSNLARFGRFVAMYAVAAPLEIVSTLIRTPIYLGAIIVGAEKDPIATINPIDSFVKRIKKSANASYQRLSSELHTSDQGNPVFHHNKLLQDSRNVSNLTAVFSKYQPIHVRNYLRDIPNANEFSVFP